MKEGYSNKKKGEKVGKITLKDYFNGLPKATFPKTEFINKIAAMTGVSYQTVRNWCIYGMKPANEEHVKALVKVTGIPKEELWES